MPKAMTKDQYVKFIVLQLGGTLVDVEIEDDIGDIVDVALLKCKPYIGTSKLVTVPGSTKIDLSKLNVYTVVNVFKADTGALSAYDSQSSVQGVQTGSASNDSYMFSPTLYNYYDAFTGVGNGIGSMDSMTITLLTNQLINTVRGGTSDIDFWQDGDDLYIDVTRAGAGGNLTIEYIPDYTDVSQISEPFWVNYIMNIAMAMAKIAMGRARSKYTIGGLPYEMDGDTLVTEGQADLDALTEQLRELDDIWYFMD